MVPTTLYARQGDTLEATVTVAELDLTDATAELQIAPTAGHDSAKTWSAAPTVVIDPSLGKITLSVDPADTSALTGRGRNWVWQLTVTFSDGRVRTLAYGQLVVQPEVAP